MRVFLPIHDGIFDNIDIKNVELRWQDIELTSDYVGTILS